ARPRSLESPRRGGPPPPPAPRPGRGGGSPPPPPPLELLQVRVLERQPLPPHAREVDGGDDVRPLLLDAHQESLAPARVTKLGPHAERQVLILHGRHGRRGRARHPRLGAPRREQHHPPRGKLPEEARSV